MTKIESWTWISGTTLGKPILTSKEDEVRKKGLREMSPKDALLRI